MGLAVSLPQQAAAPTVTAQDKKVEKHPVQAPEVIREELDEQDREKIRQDMSALSTVYAHAMKWHDPRKEVPGRGELLMLPREKRRKVPHARERSAPCHTGELGIAMPDGPPEPKIPGMVNAREYAKNHPQPQPQTTPEAFMASEERKAANDKPESSLSKPKDDAYAGV